MQLAPKPPPTPARTPRKRNSIETLPPGTQFGRYELIRRLAVGGMAELYLARATGIEGFEKIVALKRILPQHAENEDFVRMFLDEARLTAGIQHANVAQVYDIGRCDDGLFFSMEYVHGEDVRTVMQTLIRKNRMLPLEHSLAIVIGAAAGLHAAHERTGSDGAGLGIVHRDVSPSNVLVSYDGCIKLIDFGIAKATSRQTETRAGTLKGKIAYMSPEQCLGDPIDRRSDVFSLGVVLYELTTGARLFPVDNEYAAMRQIVDVDAPPPSKRKPGYPPELEAIVMRALHRDRGQRYGSAEELQLALEGFVRARGLAVSTAQLGYFMRDTFPDRASDRVGGLTPPPSPSRRILPLRPPVSTSFDISLTPTPIPIDSLPSRAPTIQPDDLAVPSDHAGAAVGTWMFKLGGASLPDAIAANDEEPSISIGPGTSSHIDAAVPASALSSISAVELAALHRQKRWHMALAVAIAASLSAVIAAVAVMMASQSSDSVTSPAPVVAPAPAPDPDPVPVPVPVPVSVSLPAPAPAPALSSDPAPAPKTTAPPRSRSRSKAKANPKSKPPSAARPSNWNPDSALPPM